MKLTEDIHVEGLGTYIDSTYQFHFGVPCFDVGTYIIYPFIGYADHQDSTQRDDMQHVKLNTNSEDFHSYRPQGVTL